MDPLIISADCIDNPPVHISRCNGDYGILYVTDGCVDLQLGTQWLYITKGQLAVFELSKGAAFLPKDDPLQSYFLRIRAFSPSEIVQYYRLHSEMFANADALPMVFPFQDTTYEIRDIFDRIIREFKTERNHRNDLLDLLLQDLLIRICREKEDAVISVGADTKKLATLIQKRLNAEYEKNISVAQLASEFNLSASRLSHIFKGETGVSVMKYLQYCRISAAKKYLSESTLLVGEIVERCGFSDYNNFSRVFKREVGCSPTQYRRTHQR